MAIENNNCSCAAASPEEPSKACSPNKSKTKYLLTGTLVLAAWGLIYMHLKGFAAWFTYGLLNLTPEKRLSSALEFFVLDVPKIFMLLTLIVFVMGVVRTFFTAERTRMILAGKRESYGNLLASMLGIVTPFCTCSAIPLFIGFLTAGVPLGVTFSFLISAPMINEIALVMLFGLFGWRVALIYMSTGLFIAIVAGWVIGRMKMEKYVEPWVYQAGAAAVVSGEELNWSARIDAGIQAIKDIVGKVWPYIVGGIAIGASIHGYVPDGLLAGIMGKGAWWAVPVAVLIGIPMYSNAAGIIPVVQALLAKGAALGTVLAFMMAVIGLSLPEMIILRKVLTIRLIAVFVGVVGFGILAVGYLFNFLKI